MQSGGEGKALPDTAIIPPLVSILDAVDANNSLQPTPTFTPTREFDYTFAGTTIKWQFEHDCAATLIGSNTDKQLSYLLTSAHCVTDIGKNTTIDAPADKRIVVGNQWCEIASPSTCKFIEEDAQNKPPYVSQILVHKDFVDPNTGYYTNHDFAILVVKGILKYNGKAIKPMPIAKPNGNWHENASLYVAGWGSTDPEQFRRHEQNPTNKVPSRPDRPNYAPVNSLPAKLCQTLINNISDSTQFKIQASSNICSGVQAVSSTPRQSTACYGDSGGPLFATNSAPSNWNHDADFLLVGNVSWSPTLCQPVSCHREYASDNETCNSDSKMMPSPTIYGFPGAVFCQRGFLQNKHWLVNDNMYATPPVSEITAKELLNALPGFNPTCQ